MKRRVLALLLTAAMLLGMTPVSAVEAESTVITGFAALEQDVMEAETGTAREDLGLPETVTATVLETVTTLTGNGEGEDPTVTTEEVETEREISVEWSTPLFGGYDPDQAGEYTFTAGAQGYVLAEGVAWPTVTVVLTEPAPEAEAEAETEAEAAPETEPEVQALPVITGFTVNGDTSYEVAAHEEMTEDYIAAGLAEDVIVTAAVDGEDVVLPVDWSCPDFNGQTEGVYTFTAYAQGYALADGAAWPAVTVEVTGAEPLATYTVNTESALRSYMEGSTYAGSTVQLTGNITITNTITVTSNRTLNLVNYTLTMNNASGQKAIFDVQSGTLTMNSGTLSTNSTNAGIVCVNGGTVNSNNVNYKSTSTSDSYKPTAFGTNTGTIIVNGGTISTDSIHSTYGYKSGGNLQIKNCTFTGTQLFYANYTLGGTNALKISGGTYSVDPSRYLVPGYVSTLSGGKYTVRAATASRTSAGATSYYATLQAAVNAAAAGGTVALLANTSETVTVSKSFGTLEWNGKTLTGSLTINTGYTVDTIQNTVSNAQNYVTGGVTGQTTISGAVGEIKGGLYSASTTGGALSVAASGTLGTISGGQFKNSGSGYAVEYADGAAGGTDITGGVFAGTGGAINFAGALTSPIVLEGGYFSSNSTNSSEYVTGTLSGETTTLPSGYGGITGSTTGYYTVAPVVYVASTGDDSNAGTQARPFATLNKALEMVTEGGTVYVMDTVTVSEQANITKNVTINGAYTDADGTPHYDGQLLRGLKESGSTGLITVSSGTATLSALTYDGNGTDTAYQNSDASITVQGGATLKLNAVVIRNHNCKGSADGNQDKGVINVAANGILYMTGGELSNNTEAQSNFGILSVLSNGQATLTDVAVTGNKQTVSGPILKADDEGGSLTLAGNTTITDNQAPSGAVYATALNLSGKPIIRNNTTNGTAVRNVYRSAAVPTNITVTEALAEGSAVGVTDDNAAAGVAFATATDDGIASASAGAFFQDAGPYAAAASGESLVWAGKGDYYVSSTGNDSNAGTREKPFATLNKALEMVAEGGTVYVMDTVTVSEQATITKNVTITGAYTDANGDIQTSGQLLRGLKEAGSTGLIEVGSGTVVTMMALTYDGNGANTSYQDSDAAITVRENATLNLNDVVIQNHHCKGGADGNLDKGVIHVAEGGTLHMTGGALRNNTETMTTWGIISGVKNSQVTLTDVTVTGNKQTATGTNATGPILMVAYEGASLTLAGSTTITGNRAPYGAVYATALNLSGQPVIQNNTTNGTTVRNVYLDTADKTITVTGALAEGSAVGVSQTGAALGSIFATATDNGIATASAGAFFQDAGPYIGAANGESLVWAAQRAYYVSSTGNDSNAGTREKPFATLNKALTLVADGGTVYVMDNVTGAGLNADFAKSVTITTDPLSVTEDFTAATATLSAGSSLMTLNGADSTVTLKDITLKAAGSWGTTCMITVTSGALVLDSGATVTGYSGTYSPVYINGADGSVTLNEGAAITGNTSSNASGADVNRKGHGGGVYMADGALTLNGGSITNNTATYRGGGVCAYGGTFTMRSGVISGNKVTSTMTTGYGGGVALLEGAAMTMEGGSITNNSAGLYGGGVSLTSASTTMNMTGGVISNNTAGTNGGGVYANSGTFTMSDGGISGNEAPSGGGVYVAASTTFTMSGGSITGNKGSSGGGVHVYENGTFTMSGGEISGNTATNDSGGVRLREYATSVLNLSGDASITGNTLADGTVSNVLRYASSSVNVTGALTGSVGVTPYPSATLGGTVATASTEAIAEDSAAHFFHDGGTYVAAASGTDLVWTGQQAYYVSSQGSDSNPGTREKPFATLPQALSMVADGGTVYVMDNVACAGVNADYAKSVTITTDPDSVTESFSTATATLSAGSSLMTLSGGADQTVTLENITLTANGFWNAPLVTVASGELVLNSGATITGYTGYSAPVVISAAEGSVTLNEGASITGNHNSYQNSTNTPYAGLGGGVYVKSGTLTMNGGSITGNGVTNGLGGGVCVGTGGAFTMTGGAITGNTARNIDGNSTLNCNGGGVSVDGGTLTMTGGEISGNTAYVNGGGVYLANSATTVLNLSGGASITGNTLTDSTTVNNVYKQASSVINVTDTLTGPVGVTDASAAAGGAFATANSADIATASVNAFSDDTGGYVVSTSSASLVWQADTKEVYVASTGSDTTGTGSRAKPYATLNKAMTAVDDGGTVYVMDDVTSAGYSANNNNYAKNVTITTDPKALTKDEAGNVTGGIATVTLTGPLAIPYAGNTITLENITFDGTGCPAGSAIFYIGTADGKYYGKLHLKSGTTIQNFTDYWGPVFTGSNANNTVTVERGARIINNTNNGATSTGYSSSCGGGITMNGGTLIMNGGEISGNTAPNGGGGVYLASSVKMVMNGGVISGNTASGNGGGLYISTGAAMTMSDGEISGNTATSSGGGVFLYGSMTMTGGAIRGNTANINSSYGGGGVCMYTTSASGTGTLTMTGGSITENTAPNSYGGGISMYNSLSYPPALKLSGDANITGNTDQTGTSNIHRYSYGTVTVTGALTGTVGVTYGSVGSTFATADSEEIAAASAAHFFHDTGVYLVGTSGANLVWTGQMEYYVASSTGSFTGSDSNPGTREKPFATLNKALTMVADGGTVYVMDDITEARSNIQNAKNVTITTDPQSKEDGAAVVTMTGTTSVVIQTSGTTLTLENIVFDGNGTGNNAPFILGVSGNSGDSGKLVLESGAVIRNFAAIFGAVWTNTNTANAITIKAGASITGNTNTYNKSGSSYNSGYGGGITLRGGALTMEGGEISGNKSTYNGAGVYLANSGATMTMSGGAISGNAGNYGGGVYSDGGSVTMTGGEIRENTSTYYGGGVEMATGALTMSGGKISGNTAAQYGGGVYLNNNTTLNMSGGEISGNTATKNDGGGLYIATGAVATMTGGASITGNTAGANGGGVCTYNTGTLTMDGGTITGNTAATQGGGVYVVNTNGAALNLSGDTSITGNTLSNGTANNVYRAGANGKITVTGNLTGSVGVTYGGAGTIFATANDAGIANASAAHFLHDGGTCKAVAESTSLKWALREAIQLAAPTMKSLDYTSVTIDVTAGQTYLLRETATGEALQTFAATEDGTHTFQDLAAGTAYYIYTTKPGQGPNDDPYYTDSANTVVRTRALAGTELIQDGSFEKQNADKVWLGLNVDSAVANPEIGVGKTSYGLTAADGNYVCELNGTSNTYPEAVYQKVSVYPGATINVTASVAKRASYNGTMQIGVMPATESPVWSDFTAAALTPTVTSGSAAVNDTVITPVSGWSRVQCTYTVPEGVYEVYVIFQALTPTGGAGNLIDKISVKEAAEYYVSSTGSDTDGIGTREKPYATLDKAVGTLPEEGGTIHVMNRVNVGSQLEIGETVTITGTDGKGNAYADAALVNTAIYATVDGNSLGGVFVVNSGGVLTLDHLTLDNTEGVDNRAVRVYTGGALTLSETTIQNFGVAEGGSDYTAYAVYSNGAVTLKDGSRITGNLMGGIQIAAGTLCAEGSATVTGNTKDGVKSNVSLASGLTVTVTGTLTGALGVTQAGAAADGIFATTTDATVATDSAGAFSDDTGAYKVAADGTSLKWAEREKTPLDAPTVSGVDTTSVTIDVKAGQTYILRETADGEARLTYAATEDGTYTFEGLTAGTTYYIYTTKPGQAVDAEPYYGDSANTVAKTRPLAGAELIEQGSFEGEWNTTSYYLGVKDESGAYYNPWKNTSSPIVEAGNSTSIGYGQAAKDGSNICELNYQQNGVIYQKVSVAPGAVLNISVWYAARGSAGTQIMQVCAMPASTEATDANFADNALTPTVASGSATVSGTEVTAASGWSQVTCTYTVPAGVNSIYVGFRSVTPTGDAGNLIDLVSVKEVAQYYVSSTGSDETGNGTRENPYATLAKAVSMLPADGDGTIYVMDTVTQTAAVSIGKNVTITGKYSDANGDIHKEGVLLRDTALNNSHLLTVTGGNVTLADITLDGKNVTPAALYGDTGNTNALLSITGGTATLDSGAILQNNNGGRNNNASTAGAAVVAGGALVMNEGAEIKNCSVGRYGGAVTLGKSTSATGTFTMNGGSITGNSVNNDLTTAAGYGGTVYIWYGTFTMNGGSITENTVKNGYGAGVYQDTNATVNLSGSATVTGNTADGTASNVYLANNKTITVTGNLTGRVGVTQYGAAANKNFATASSADIAAASAGAFFDDTDTYPATANTTYIRWAARLDYYVSASTGNDNNTGTREKPYKTLAKAISAVPAGGTVHVMDTVTVSAQVDIGKNVTITGAYTDADGNVHYEGKLLRGAGSWAKDSGLLKITAGTTTLQDISLDGNNNLSYESSLIRVTEASTLILKSGAVLENNLYKTTTSGIGTVFLAASAARMEMYDGAVIRNNRAIYGAAVTIYNNNTGGFYMYGGEIYGNWTSNRSGGDAAGAVQVGNQGSTFVMSGGSIHNNGTSTTYGNAGAGVCLFDGGIVRLSGAATIQDNFAGVTASADNSYTSGTKSNLYLTGSTNSTSTGLSVTGDLTGSVGVTQKSGATIGGQFAAATNATIASNSAGAFSCDTDEYVGKASSANLVWAGVVASVTKADGTVTEYGSLQAAVNAAGEGDTVTLLADTSETVTIATSFDTLEWNGKTLTGTLTVGANRTVNTVQNTVDGQQNYVTGGLSGTANTVFKISGTVGEIKGGYYYTSGYEAVTVAASGTLAAISGGRFKGAQLAVCWYTSSKGGTVITGGVFDAGSDATLGQYKNASADPTNLAAAIQLKGGYYGSTDFTYTAHSQPVLPTAGVLATNKVSLPTGYGGISTTTTYYPVVQTDFYVKSDGSDTTGDGTRENPYQTVYRAFQALNGISGTIYVMDQVYLDSATVNSGTQGTFILVANQSLTIQGDPERAEGTEARILCTAISGENEHTLRLTNSGSALTLEDVILDGQNLNRNGAIWLEGANSKLTLGQGAVITNMMTVGYGTIVGNVATASIYLTGGQITGNTITFASGAAVNLLKSSKLYISGDSAVTGNVKNGAACNIAVAGTSQLVLNGDFTGAAGVYQSSPSAGGQFGTMGNTAYTGAGNFTCDSNPALSSTANGSNLVWAANRDDIYVSLNGSDTSGDGTELKPYKTLLYAYGKVNVGGTIHVMTANVPTAVASGYVNALGKYIAVNKSVTISGEGYDGASVRHNNGNAPILMSSNSNYTTTFKDVDVTSAGSTLLRYGNADNALIDIRNGVVTLDTVTVSGHYNNATANGRSSVDWSDGTIRVAGGTLNLTDTTVTGNTTNGAVFKIGGTVNLSGATSITGNTRQGTGGANLYLKTASQSVNVADNFEGTVGVTQVGTAQGVILAVATGETQAQAKTGMFTDDASTGFEVRTSGANLIWGKDNVTYVPDKYRIVVISDNADETFTINGTAGTKVYDEELGQYVTTFEGLNPNTIYPVASSKGTTQNVKTLNITALEKAIRSASPFTVYEGETVSLATVLGSKVAHLSGCVSLTDMSISDESYATVSGSGRTAKITGVQVTGDQQIDLTLTASTRGCGVYGTCNTGEITIQIIVVPKVVIRTTVADRNSIVVGDCSTKLQYALYDASGNLVSNWVSPSDDGEGGLYVRFEGLSESTNYTVKARYGDGDNDYGIATKAVKTTATSALQKAIESASPFTIYEGETVTLASVLGSKVYHLSGCVSLSKMNVADTTIATVSGSGRTATITGVKLGSTDITMTASTTGCYYYGTTTADGVKITVNVIPKMEIKSVSTTTESITVSDCDPRFQYALYDADGNPVSETEWLTPNEDGTITWVGLTDKTNYTVTVRYGDGDNSYGTASKTVTTGQIYTGTVEELYSYSQGTGVTAGFKVSMAENPGTGYTLQVTDASGNPAGTATLQGSWYGGNYVVKVTGLTAGTTYTVQAVVGGNAVGEALEWTAPAATYSSHNSTGNTSGYWSSSDVSTKTDSSGATQVVSGIAYNVKSNGMSVDIQGYGKTKTTYANAGWTVKVSGGSNLWVWAEPTIVKGESGADYVVLTYHIRNNSASSLSNVWLGANADIMIGSNDRAPVYMEGYGIRTAVNEADDALSFAIITQHGGGVAEYADSVTTRWFGYYGYRNNYTFSNTNSTSLTGTDSGAAFSWKIGALAAGETKAYSVVIGVAGKEDQNTDITNPDPFTPTETGPEDSVTQTQLAAPTVTETTTDSVTIQVKAGQTYILRLDAEGESYMEFEATADGTYTFEGLAPSSTYYIYTKLTEQDANANPFYTESANATAATKATAPGQPKGEFILHDPAKDEATLTYTFPNAEATLTNVENFKNLSVMVDTGSFTLTQEALTALGSYGSVAGVNASGGYVRTAAAGSRYTYLIFSGTFTKTQAENFLRALIFNAEDYGVYQQVDVDADVIDLPSGVARLGSSYYRYVAYRGITWSNAYKAAKASSFNGLPGYLITVDSSVEHNFVYQTYGSVNGWMGGVRTTAASGFDGAAYNPSNPGTSGAWKWVCGPNAGDPFWNGWNSSASNRIPGVYANWNSGEPNNASGEWAAQYGFGSGGRWNDYKPTNSAIGGYFIEYTAYGSYSAADPMAHDDQTNVFGAPVAVIWVNGAKGTKTYSTLAKALEDYTDSTNQVIQMIADTEEDSVTIGQDVYLDLNGHEVKADITVSEGFTLYGLDTTTDGYKDLEKYGQITGTVTGQVGSITKTTKSHFAKAKNYLPVSNGDNSLEFHRFNTVVYKYTGKIDNEADTAMLNYTLGFQGDSTVVGQLEAIGAGARISGSGSTYTYGWNYDLSAVPSPSNPYLYDTNLVNLSTTGMVNGYTTYYDLVGALKFGGVQVDSESVKRSFLQVLKLYYNKTNAQEKEEIMTFITNHNLNTEWEALG